MEFDLWRETTRTERIHHLACSDQARVKIVILGTEMTR
jgi:hypothetical protein